MNAKDAPSATLPLLLAKSLPAMVRLERLTLIISNGHTTPFESVFHQENVFLPKVVLLVVGPGCHFLLKSCPNVNTLATSSFQWLRCSRDGRGRTSIVEADKLLKAMAGPPRLMHFAMFAMWNVELLEDVLSAVPGLLSLSMECDTYQAPLSRRLPILAQFANLQYLALPPVFNLNVNGFAPPWGRNADEDPTTIELVCRQHEIASILAARKVFSACKSLHVLWLGDDTKAEIVRSNNADVGNIIWTEGEREKLCE